MDYNLYIPDQATHDAFRASWPTYIDLLVEDFSCLTKRHTVILKPGLRVLDEQFFNDIQALVAANNYLDALKHSAWIVVGNEYVKLNKNRDYWSLNLRPVIGFDSSTWKLV